MSEPELGTEFELFGYKILANPGFAMPLFRSCNFQSNAIYLASTEISGDQNSRILDFDVTDLEPDRYLCEAIKLMPGMRWRTVLCVDEKEFIGLPDELFVQLASLSDRLEKTAPLTMVDLALASKSESTAKYFRSAQQHLSEQFGLTNSGSLIAETTLRKLVNIAFARCFESVGERIDIPSDFAQFSIHLKDEDWVEVQLGRAASLYLDDQQKREFVVSLQSDFALLGLRVAVRGDGFTEGQETEEPVNERSTRVALPKRTRRFGLVREIAIDVGTTNTRIFSGSQGLIISQPSVVALRQRNGYKEIIAVGDEALLMEDRTPDDVIIVRPLRDGAIADLEIASEMIKYFIEASGKKPTFLRPLDVVICVPSGSTAAERRSIANAARSAGASEVSVIQQPMAAAIGAGAPVLEPVGSMILNIGGGTTEVAIVTMRGVAYATSVRTGGDKMTDDVIDYFRRWHNLLVGRSTAERAKKDFGVAAVKFADEKLKFRVRGRDLVHGVPKEIEITQVEFAQAFENVTGAIIETIKIALENTAPELAADVIETGVLLTGGGARLNSISRLVEEEIGLPVHVPDEPEAAVARGIGMAMNDPVFQQILAKA